MTLRKCPSVKISSRLSTLVKSRCRQFSPATAILWGEIFSRIQDLTCGLGRSENSPFLFLARLTSTQYNSQYSDPIPLFFLQSTCILNSSYQALIWASFCICDFHAQKHDKFCFLLSYCQFAFHRPNVNKTSKWKEKNSNFPSQPILSLVPWFDVWNTTNEYKFSLLPKNL